jgi:vacuolar-type H+-ATPase subunit H
MTTTFTQGQTVCLLDGHQCRFISEAPGGFIVEKLYDVHDDEEGEPYEEFSAPQFEQQVFATAPEPRFDTAIQSKRKQVASLNEEIQAHQKAVNELRLEKHELTQQKETEKQLMARLSRYEALQYLEDIIEKRMTHAVTLTDYSVSVMTIEAALRVADDDRESSYSRDVKLLALYGKTGGDLQWGVHKYSNHYGGHVEIRLFKSLDEAFEFAKLAMAARFVKVMSEKHRDSLIEDAIKCAIKIGADVPQDAKNLLAGIKAEKEQVALRSAEAALSKAQAEVDRLRSGEPI